MRYRSRHFARMDGTEFGTHRTVSQRMVTVCNRVRRHTPTPHSPARRGSCTGEILTR